MNRFLERLMPSVVWEEEDGAGGGAGGAGGGSDEPITAGSGFDNQDGQGGAGGSGGAPSNPLDGLDGDSQQWLKANGIIRDGEPADVKAVLQRTVKKGREVESLVGKSVRVPGDDASEEEVARWKKSIGVPETPDGYRFSLPADLPAEMPYNQALADNYKGFAHKIGLTPKQASEMHNWFARQTANDMQSMTEGKRQTAVSVTQTLEKEGWGPAGGAQYRANLEYANQGLKLLGGDETLNDFKKAGLIGDNGEIYSASLAKALSKAGKALASEDDGRLVGERAILDNPFAEGGNITNQMRLIKQAKEGKADPKRVRAMMMSAGKQPKDLGLHEDWGL